MKYESWTELSQAESLHHLGELLPLNCIEECTLSGDNSDGCEYWIEELGLQIPCETCRDWLSQEGAWCDGELNRMNNCELNTRVLWLAAWLAKEEM